MCVVLQVVKAFVILTKEAENAANKEELVTELQNHVKETTAPYKYPRKVIIGRVFFIIKICYVPSKSPANVI